MSHGPCYFGLGLLVFVGRLNRFDQSRFYSFHNNPRNLFLVILHIKKIGVSRQMLTVHIPSRMVAVPPMWAMAESRITSPLSSLR